MSRKIFRIGIYTAVYFLILIPVLFICSDRFAIDDREAAEIALSLLLISVCALSILHKKSKKTRKFRKHYALNLKIPSFHIYRRKLILPFTALLVLVITFAAIKIKAELFTIPDNVIEFVQKYPEAQEFADNYCKYHSKDSDIDVTTEIESKDIPLFIQWDKRWGYHEYGSSLIGISGCGPTCLSMIFCGLTKNASYTPVYVADFSQQHSYYIPGQGTSWDLFSSGASLLGLDSEFGSVDEDYITDKLQNHQPLVCSMKPGDFTYTGHFIVLTGLDSDGRVIVNDPNSRNNSTKHWDLSVLLPQIKGVWSFSLKN